MLPDKLPQMAPAHSPRLLYLLPGLYLGGAEKGFLTLLDNGFFDGIELQLVALFRGTDALRPHLEARGTRYRILHDVTKRQLTDVFRAALEFRREVRWSKPDILLMSLPLANIVGRLLTPRKSGPYRISFEHSIEYARSIYHPILRLLSSRIDGAMADCDATFEAMGALIPSNVQRWKVPLVALDNAATYKTDYSLQDPVRILSVGRLVREKNYGSAIEAISILRRNGLNVEYSIVGDGPEMYDLKKICQNTDLKDYVKFLGERSDWRNDSIYYDIFFHSSSIEGLCLSIIEAMHAGLPVVCTNVGGVKEYAQDQKNVFFSESPKPEHLAVALKYLIQNIDLRACLGRHACGDVRHKYSAPQIRKVLSDIRKEMIFDAYYRHYGANATSA